MTSKEIIDRVRIRIKSEKIPQVLILSAINDSILKIYNWLIQKKIYFDYKEESFSTSIGVSKYLKNGIIKKLSIDNTALNYIPIEDIPVYSETSKPFTYSETVTDLILIPTPNAVYNIKKHYIPFPLKLTTQTSIFPYPDDFISIVIIETILALSAINPEVIIQDISQLAYELTNYYENIYNSYRPVRSHIEYFKWEGID